MENSSGIKMNGSNGFLMDSFILSLSSILV